MRTLSLSVLLLGAAHAFGQVEPEPDPPRAVVQYINPRFPEVARAKGVKSARVVLELVLSPNGGVSQARVTTSGGAEFDAAALEAIRGSTFAPAKKTTTQPFTVSFQLN